MMFSGFKNVILGRLVHNDSKKIFTGTLVPLSDSAIEKELSARVFNLLDVDGYCMTKPFVNDFVINTINIANNSNLKGCEIKKITNELYEFYKFSKELPNKIKRICVYTENPCTIGNGNASLIYKIALRNHERMHALTIDLSSIEINLIDYIMYHHFNQLWDDVTHHILGYQCNSGLVDQYGNTWTAVIEGVARIAAVLHAPKEYQKFVASYQLSSDRDLLLKLSFEIESKFGSIENLLEEIKKD